MFNNKLAIAKGVTNFIVGASVTKVVNDIIVNNTSPEDFTEKVQIAVGSAVIGSMVVDHAKDHVSTGIDKFVAAIREARSDKNDVSPA